VSVGCEISASGGDLLERDVEVLGELGVRAVGARAERARWE